MTCGFQTNHYAVWEGPLTDGLSTLTIHDNQPAEALSGPNYAAFG